MIFIPILKNKSGKELKHFKVFISSWTLLRIGWKNEYFYFKAYYAYLVNLIVVFLKPETVKCMLVDYAC